MKNKFTAAIFALFFGWTGAHRFYLGQSGLGVLYAASFLIGWFIPFLFILRWIPVFLGLIDAAALIFMNKDDFHKKYNSDEYHRKMEYRSERHRMQRDRRRKPDFERKIPKEATINLERKKLRSDNNKSKNPFTLSGIRKFKEYDIKGALEDFKKGLELNPDDISLHFNMACAYSLLEDAEQGFKYLDKAVALGFNDNEKIQTHEALAFLRIQPRWDQFQTNGYRIHRQIEAPKEDLLSNDQLLTQLQKLAELRKKGLITEEEYLMEKNKLEA
jgi:TM2 domain-containing membrane protein YozV